MLSQHMVSDENLYVSKPGPNGEPGRILREDESPEDRQYLLAAKGAVIPYDQAVKYGLKAPGPEVPQRLGVPDISQANATAAEFDRLNKRIAELEEENRVLQSEATAAKGTSTASGSSLQETDLLGEGESLRSGSKKGGNG